MKAIIKTTLFIATLALVVIFSKSIINGATVAYNNSIAFLSSNMVKPVIN